MLLSIVPVAYLLLRFFRIPPEHVFLVHILVEICTQYVRIRIVLPLIVMPLREYIADVIKPVLKVGILALIIPMLVYCNMNVNIASFLVVCLITACWILLVIYFIGCTKNEQFFVKGKFVAVLDKLKNNFLSVL